MREIKRSLWIVIIIFLIMISFLFLSNNFRSKEIFAPLFLENLATEAVMTGSTNDWIYYSRWYPEKGLWRIHKETRKKEHVFGDSYYRFLVLGETLFVQGHEGFYQMEPDGSNPELILEGVESGERLYYKNGWIYAFAWYSTEELATRPLYFRYHVPTGLLEKLIQDITVPVWGSLSFGSSFVVSEDYLYFIAESEGKWGILSYHLPTKERKICTYLDTGRNAPLVGEQIGEDVPMEDSGLLYLEDCGEYLVLLYRMKERGEDGDTVAKFDMYATKKEGVITEKTVWKKVQFPDMQKGTANPPNPLTFSGATYPIIEGYMWGYIFWDELVFYQNEEYELCCRPLFGKPEDVIVYEGTALPIDSGEKLKSWVGKACGSSCTLTFGKDCFYYCYYTACEEEDAGWAEGIIRYEPTPMKWADYIGELPERR